MDIRELRIGNHIRYGMDEYYQEVIVSEIQQFKIDSYNETDSFYGESDNFHPIPLTKEWLIKFGFSCEAQPYWYDKYIKNYTHVLLTHKIELEHFDDNMFIWIEGNTIIHFYTVHQLQNFWKSITGVELEVIL